MVAIPVYVRHSIHLKGGTGSRLELTVGPKQSMGKIVGDSFEKDKRFQLEDVCIEMQMPKTVLNCNLVPTHGKYSFDPTTRILQWNVGKIELGKPPTIKGTVSNH